MVPADRRGPVSRIPLHEMEYFPAPGTVGLAPERWPEVPGEQRQGKSQQSPNQGEVDDDIEDGHSGLYLLS